MILIASTLFYGFWRPEFVLLLFISAGTDFVVALKLGSEESPAKRRLLLLASLVVNLGLLFYFKYLLFFVDNGVVVLNFLGVHASAPTLSIILPLGISFYTFQTISYTFDVYRRVIAPERSFVLYGCFVTYFPQLVAGPILRASEVLYQLDRRSSFDGAMFASGLRRLAYGLFLKVVLADNIAPHVDSGFAQATDTLSALDVWTLAFLFGFQIYFDFSAYSHIAIGSARLMGISFPENFAFPYMASSPREFWRRWHISLSSWIRDYLYLPLVGIRATGKTRDGLAIATAERLPAKRNPVLMLLATWAIMGLWHGANWTFVLWGVYHAIFISLYRVMSPRLSSLPEALRRWGGWGLTLSIVMLSWIPFRAPSVGTAFDLLAKLMMPSEYLWLGMRENAYLVTALMLCLMVAANAVSRFWEPLCQRVRGMSIVGETVSFALVTALVFVFLRPIQQFIYFQF
jgi:D-alanyl-lipoteichoic acid acyltransferase DltB (MBOAT superfamily)